MQNIEELEIFKKFTTSTLKKAGEICLKYYRAEKFEELKDDKSIVTQADKDIEQYIRNEIEKKFSDHGILGEEFGGKNLNSEYVWVIDPIDGTSSFVCGRATFCIMMCLVKGGQPIFSGIYQPVTQELWTGDNESAELNGKKISASNRKEGLRVATTSLELLTVEGNEIFDKVKKQCNTIIYGGDAYNYCLLASGFLDIVFEQGLKPYDYLPLLPILSGAGAKGIISLESENLWEAKCEIMAAVSNDFTKKIVEDCFSL